MKGVHRSIQLYSTRQGQTKQYLKRQLKDEFAVKAREHSYRARSAFKLIAIDERFKIFKPGQVVVDVGCSPGSWSQVVVDRCELASTSADGYLLGIDLQHVQPLRGADIMSLSNVTKFDVQTEMRRRLKDRPVDVLLSDMAPNPSGDSATDHLRLIDLVRVVFRLFHSSSTSNENCSVPKSIFTLSDKGVFVCKIWDGVHRKSLMLELGEYFKTIKTVKPAACRDNSAELYLYCKR